MTPAKPNRTRARTALGLGAGLVLALLAGCVMLAAREPGAPSGAGEASWAFADTRNTTLGRVAADSVGVGGAGAHASSGLRLLPEGRSAFAARIALAKRAERSIDAQYYQWQDDRAGRALLRALRDAAARGVRVRLLLDDFHAAAIQELLRGFDATPRVQVRLFNPLPLRQGGPTLRLLLSPGDFELHNHRMHNKLFVVDNALAIVGGRNIGDEYFMQGDANNFVDLDVLAAGAVVPALSAVFDGYWNSALAWPLPSALGAPTGADGAAADAARARFDAEVDAATPAPPDDATDALGQPALARQLDAGRLALSPGNASVHADAPGKARDARPEVGRPGAAMQGVLDAMSGARREVGIMSPYFVPGAVGLQAIRAGARQGVRIALYTNSLASTDEPLVHYRYAGYRVELLRIGVQIHELDPDRVARSRGFGFSGRSTARLHAKVVVVDDRLLVVGSVNLDPRSAIANTEMSVVIDSPGLVAELTRLNAQKSQLALMYRLRLRPDGRTIEWHGSDDQGNVVVTTDEPGSSPWLRLWLPLQSLWVGERLL